MIPDTSKVGDLMRAVASSEVLPRFRNLSADEITEKKFGELVTIADEKAETALIDGLSSIIPGSNVIGEELAARHPSVLDKLDSDDPLWIVDPIDGTQNFTDGKTCFAMIIAFVQRGRTLAGWILEPYNNHLVWAVEGRGAWEDGLALRISRQTNIRDFRGSLNKTLREHLQKLHERDAIDIPAEMTRYACVGAEYADLARGKLEFARYMGSLKPWDHAAGILIHAEAGGFSGYTDTGEPYIPAPPQRKRAVIMAPGKDAWFQLHELLTL